MLGTVLLQRQNNHYWGEIPLSEMTSAVSMAHEKGWREAVKEIILVRHPELGDMILGQDRVDWIFRIKSRNLTILDVGSGWGQTSFLLAKDKTNTVISLEKIKERAIFQAIRKHQEKLENLHVVNGDFFRTNFFESTFDIISFIGVLEWIGTDGHPENPRNIQIKALRKACDLLKHGGFLCIGIENRLGFNNFLGARDHSGLRFTALMPRIMANMYMKLRKPYYRSNRKSNNYRTYTYAAKGYKKLLRDAGFKHIEILIAHPHYAHPRCLIEMINSNIKYFFSKIYQPNSFKDAGFTVLFRILSSLKIADIFAPHFIILSKK
jgi:SAM-dependent methyltransferase